MSALPSHVTIREVSLRDGLQIEQPIPLPAKLELLEAIAATGVREVEATAFVSPSKVPAMADAPELTAALASFPEYVVAASDEFSHANVGRSSADATALIGEIAVIAHDAGAGNLPLGAHLNNTRGAGLASAYAAVTAGVTRLDASVGGLGGCPFAPGATGNIATEDLVYMLRDSGIHVDIDLDAAIAAARVAARVVGHELPGALLRAGDRRGGG